MSSVEIRDGRIDVQIQFAEKELVKALPGSSWDSHNRVWTMPLSWTACLQLRRVFGDALEVGPLLHKWIWEEYNARIEPSHRLRSLLTPELEIAHNKDAYPFQRADVDFLHIADSALIGNVLGTGKTISALTALDSLEDALPALVVCPNSVKRAWERQAATWLEKCTPYVISGSATQKRKMLSEAKSDPTALVIINIESVRLFSRLAGFGSINLAKCADCDKHGDPNLSPTRCEVHRKELNDFGFKTVIIDECHKIKDPRAKATRAVWAVAHDKSVTRRWGMTGTPIANDVSDLWSVMHMISPSEWPTKSKFVDTYAQTAWNAFGGISVIGINPHRREEFFNILNPRFRRVLKEEVMEQLPKTTHSVRFVQMDPKQTKAYKQLQDLLTTRLENGDILTVQNNLTKATRLLQLASSYAKIDVQPDGDISVQLAEPSTKLDALEDILDELGPEKQVVIASQSKQLLMLAAARFKKHRINEPFGLITGDQNEWERDQAIQQFKAGDLRAILMTIQAGGTGVDGLQCADTMIVLQWSWSMIENIQLIGRIDRFGQKSDNIHIVHIIAEGTIEESRLYPRLNEKFSRLDEITKDRAKLESLGRSDTTVFDLKEAEIYSSTLF